MFGEISENDIDSSVSGQVKSPTSFRKALCLSETCRASPVSGNSDMFIPRELTFHPDLNGEPPKEKHCECQHKKDRSKILREFKQGQFYSLLRKAYFKKLRACAIMSKVELEIAAAVDARDTVLRGSSLTRGALEYELAKLDKHCRRFIRLGNFYRTNDSLENNYKLNEENLNINLDFHC